MYYSVCEKCGRERITDNNVIFNKTDCWECNSSYFGLIRYLWISEDHAKDVSEERGIEIEYR